MRTQYDVDFSYVDFDGQAKSSTATIFEDGEWFYAQNLATFGCGKRVSSAIAWHPVHKALEQLIGLREVKTWSRQPNPRTTE
jgi:hypothetical protein